MKKNKMMRLASFLLVATLLTTTMISGTFAKYTSEATGEATAAVAKWSFEANDTDIATNDTFEIKVFDTIKDTAGAAETDVAAGKIAPGTTGSFDIVLENTSEVTAKYTIDYTVENGGVPLVYKVDGAVLADVTEPVVLIAGASETITVHWEWPYEGGTDALDNADTQLGIDATAAPTVTAKITATQVD